MALIDLRNQFYLGMIAAKDEVVTVADTRFVRFRSTRSVLFHKLLSELIKRRSLSNETHVFATGEPKDEI